MSKHSVLLILLFSCFISACVGSNVQVPQYDLVIRDGMVIDGTGVAAVKADVAIKNNSKHSA